MYANLILQANYKHSSEHFAERLKERYDIQMSDKEYKKLLKQLKKEKPFVLSRKGKYSMHCTRIAEKFVYVLFNQTSGLALTCFLTTTETWNKLVNRKEK